MLQIQNLHKTFNEGTVNEVRALRGVNLEIEKGNFVIVLGANGSGKSTLLNAIAGSIQPDEGTLLLEGNEITHWPEYKRASLIGRVFQNPFMGTAPEMSIAENFAMASKRGKFRGLGWALNSTLVHELKEKVSTLGMGLESRVENKMGTLSGGQRQALTLLMATWVKPELLLLDEHTAALDPGSAAQIIQLTRDVVSREELTTFMVTHSMQQAVELGDRLIIMSQGEVIHDFNKEEKLKLKVEDLVRLIAGEI